jgi:hypothetical protein
MKKCSICKIEKKIDEFHKSSGTYCKPCSRAYARSYRKRYYQAHKEEVLEYKAEYQKKNKDKAYLWTKRWLDANKEKMRAYYRSQYYARVMREQLEELIKKGETESLPLES